MEKEKQKKPEESGEEKAAERLPYCRHAPSAEHGRAHDDDEPCDDGRTGKLEED